MRLTEIPLLVSAIAFLIAYAWAVLGQLQGGWSTLASAVMTLSWAIFVGDYFVRLTLAKDKRKWFVRNLLDLAIVVLPMLRPLRLLRLVAVLAVFQRIGGTHLVGRVVLYVSVSTVMLIFVGSLAMLSVERHQPGATITSYGDALWWAVVTMTTVGYGDMYPVSAEGRLIAVALMVGGIALLGVVTATVATWLIQKVAEQDETSQAATRAQVRQLTDEVRALRATLEPGRPQLDSTCAGTPADSPRSPSAR
jgi:voltage-gated potassium channel